MAVETPTPNHSAACRDNIPLVPVLITRECRSRLYAWTILASALPEIMEEPSPRKVPLARTDARRKRSRLRSTDDRVLRCPSCVGYVTKRSGKSRIVLMRQAADVRLRNAVYHWARVAGQHDIIRKAGYKAL